MKAMSAGWVVQVRCDEILVGVGVGVGVDVDVGVDTEEDDE
jgi:hypothetical protein